MNNKISIGVDLGGTNISAGRVEGNRIVELTTSKVSSQASEKVVIEELIQTIEEIFDPGIDSIGVGVPSLVDTETGVVYDVHFIPSWKKVPLKEILEGHFQKSVYINNDANCFAVGEKHFGKGKKYRHFVGLTIGTGLGAGIIIDDKLYSGANCGAGEFGVIPYKDAVLEHYCSGQFFINKHGLQGDEVFAKASQGDMAALDIFNQFGSNLGEAMTIIMLAVDPEAIIIGGSIAAAFPFFERAMRERMEAFPYKNPLQRLIIETSDQPQIAILGAAALHSFT